MPMYFRDTHVEILGDLTIGLAVPRATPGEKLGLMQIPASADHVVARSTGVQWGLEDHPRGWNEYSPTSA